MDLYMFGGYGNFLIFSFRSQLFIRHVKCLFRTQILVTENVMCMSRLF